jgi:ABC-2 type transport system permease protein
VTGTSVPLIPQREESTDMTTTTTPSTATAYPTVTAAAAMRPADGSAAPGSGLLTATLQSARRTLLQFARTPQLLFMGTIQGALFLFVFRYILGGAMEAGGRFDYVDFLVPGFLVSAILWGLMAAPPGIAEDAASGVHDRLRSLPMPRLGAVAGRSLADTVLCVWNLAITAAVGFGFGFRAHGGLADFLVGCGLLAVGAWAFSWLFLCLGLVSANAQSAQAATLIVVPLTFVSSAYVPALSLPGWMQPVSNHSPVTVLSNALRSLLLGGAEATGLGHTTGYWVGLSLAWCAGIALVFGAIATRRFSRQR